MWMESFDEPKLVERARRDPEAFAGLYQRYLPRVYRYLYLRLGSQQDAEDVTSQVFLEALSELQRNLYKDRGCFPAWLFTIARRRLLDFQCKRHDIVLDEYPDPAPDLIDQIQFSEKRKHLSLLLDQLDEDKRELLRLRFAAQLSFAEIGMLENRSEEAVKMAVYRIIKRLRENWEAENG